jgi:hypothetical protein
MATSGAKRSFGETLMSVKCRVWMAPVVRQSIKERYGLWASHF